MDRAKRSSKSSNKSTGRPKSYPPKAGYTATKRRYGCGGKLSKK